MTNKTKIALWSFVQGFALAFIIADGNPVAVVVFLSLFFVGFVLGIGPARWHKEP